MPDIMSSIIPSILLRSNIGFAQPEACGSPLPRRPLRRGLQQVIDRACSDSESARIGAVSARRPEPAARRRADTEDTAELMSALPSVVIRLVSRRRENTTTGSRLVNTEPPPLR